MSIAALLEDLNDDNAVTFTENQLLRYLNEGRQLIASLNPAYYADVHIFKLDPGSIQRFCECEVLVSVLGEASLSETVDDCGDVILGDSVCENITPIPTVSNETREKYSQSWGCSKSTATATGSDYTIDNLTIVDEGGGFIIINPPVPDNTDVYIAITCVPKFEDLTADSDFSGKDSAALMQWALYRAHMVDTEDASSLQIAQTYLRTFADLTKITFRALQYVVNTEQSDRSN